MANIILCIGKPGGPHTREVEKQVKSLDSAARLVHFYPLCGKHFIEITAGKISEHSPSCLVVVDGERIPAESIKSVCYRWGPELPSKDDDLQGLIAKDFARKEWKSVIRSLASYLSHARWLNPLAALELLDCKPYQLRLAQQVGLTVPRTTISNNPAAVERIFNEVDHGRVVFKSLTPLFLPTDDVLFTTEITRSTLSQASIVKCPAIYQELVERRSDLRIAIVGQEVFVARIASQQLHEQRDRLDWRRCQYQEELYSEAQISESFKERLLEFHKRAGLNYAAYDFLERGDDIVFLECNPLGAWLWIEDILGFKVSEHIARFLLGRDDGESIEQL